MNASYFDYNTLNFYNGTRSPTGTVENDLITSYFMRSLYQRTMSVINFNLPEYWDKQYFINVLFRIGFIGVIPTDKYGVIPQICTLSGYGLYLQPTDIIVAQPLVNFNGKIGVDCELIKLTPDFHGIWDIIEHYAIQLSKCFTSINTSLENSRVAMIAVAKNRAASETLKAVSEKISSGEPIIITDAKLKSDDITGNDPLFLQAFDVKNTYITDKLLENLETILIQFDREIGIPTVDQKKERMINNEVNALISDSTARIKTWITCLEESISRVNNMFPDLNISFTSILEEVKNESYSTDNIDRPI